ncbi:universal stress protein [Salinimicrobium marinum]|nr:universal stress protein [Salinimicrobium marinum]
MMNVLILSDFSAVAINATHYAMDLLQKEEVHFTLLNIYVSEPGATEEAITEKRNATKAILEERVQKLSARFKGRLHRVSGCYFEGKLVNAARDFVQKNEVDLIVMGAVSKRFHHKTILGDHTFEIISKIKCNILAVPEDSSFTGLKRMLMPVDFSASFGNRNLQFLNFGKFFHKTRLSVREIMNTPDREDEKRLKQELFKDLNHIRADFATLDESAVYDQKTWTDIQNKFDLIVILGKNIKICERLLHNRHGLYTSAPNRLPILVLHD